jgi:hypothetical protein
VRLSIEFDWEEAGEIKLDTAGALRFPAISTDPGIYRFALSSAKRTSVYIGEADNLDLRMQQYRTPDPSQPTNFRLNSELRRVLAAGGQARAAFASRARLQINQKEVSFNLLSRGYRVLTQHAAVVEAVNSGAYEIIDLLKTDEG